jgi:hypothetical protein
MPIPARRSIMAPLSNLFRKKRSLDDLRSTSDERVAALELARGRLARASEAVASAAIEGSDLLDAAETEMRASEDRVNRLPSLLMQSLLKLLQLNETRRRSKTAPFAKQQAAICICARTNSND